MKLRPIAGIVLATDLSDARQSGAIVSDVVTWVAIDIVLWGFITRYLNTVSGAGVDFVPTLAGRRAVVDFCTRIMQGVTTAFLEDVWSRNFLNLFSSPLSISEYISGFGDHQRRHQKQRRGGGDAAASPPASFHLQFFPWDCP